MRDRFLMKKEDVKVEPSQCKLCEHCLDATVTLGICRKHWFIPIAVLGNQVPCKDCRSIAEK